MDHLAADSEEDGEQVGEDDEQVEEDDEQVEG